MLNKITKTSKQIVLFFDSSFVYFRLLGHYSRTIGICFETHAFKHVFLCIAGKVKRFMPSISYPITKDLVRDNRNSAMSLSHPVPTTKQLVRLYLNLECSSLVLV